MNKRFTKIICGAVAVISALGVTLAAGCSPYYGASALAGDYSKGNPVSNGGFAVEKGDYVYFINGQTPNTVENKYGAVEKGGIYRISAKDLADRNYSSVDCVVPLVTYTPDYDSGLFIYGDYIYYGTPSTAKNSDGETLNNNLDLKRTRLDGTQTRKEPFVQLVNTADNSYEYRFVEKDGVVYILYSAPGEKLYEESDGVTNLHSFNTETGKDVLLAYNVENVIFDGEDKTNPRVYYTMKVKNYSNDADYAYNQLYTVTADTTEANVYDTSEIVGWNEDKDKGEVDRYINCGDLVFDGVSKMDDLTPFNNSEKQQNDLRYTYSAKSYVNNTLFYTRKSSNSSGSAESLFALAGDITADGKNPITRNPSSDSRILADGSSASDYQYIFENGKLTGVIIQESDGLTVNKVGADGKLQPKPIGGDKYYYIVRSAATILFRDGNYIYYSMTGGNGHTVYRIDYTGTPDAYGRMPVDDKVDDFTSTKILDLDASSDWFKPEIIGNQLFFASQTTNMTDYNYVMVCDLRDADGKMMTNAQIDALNDLYKGISELTDEFGDSKKYPAATYANIVNALKYAFYTGESADVYLNDLAKACNDGREEDTDLIYSEQTLAEYAKFINPTEGDANVWKTDYSATRKINGKDVYANRQQYYYSVIGKMTEADEKAYSDGLKDSYLQSYPEDNSTWWENINTAAKVGFIIGMCALGLAVIGGGAVTVVLLLRRRKKRAPEYRKKIKVDTTDDKDIDVYGEGKSDGANE